MEDALGKSSQASPPANAEGIDFLLTEISLGMTFMEVAESYAGRERQNHARENAEKAYRSALSFLPRLHLNDAQTEEITARLNVLKRLLKDAGFIL